MTEDITFGTWLRQRRRSLDLTQQALAEQAGCARITLRRIEADELRPSKELALILLEKLGVPKAEHEPWVRFARGLAGLPNPSLHSQPPGGETLYSHPAEVSSLPTGTVVFLYSDLVGFTPRWERDPDATLELLARHDRLLHPMLAEYGGKVFNVRGDNFVVAFTDPLRAVEAAINAQQLLAREDWGPLGPVQMKMTLHIGQAKMHSSGRYVSLALASLEPMEKFAQSGQILLSQAMADAVRAHLPKKIQLADLGEYVISTREPAAHLFQLVVSELT
jgi:class 3 adenylate cyclase/DNA-binding XRE family transcriptional regulator